MPTFQPLFRSLQKKISNLASKKSTSLSTSYKKLPDTGGRNQRAHIAGDMGKEMPVSGSWRNNGDLENDFALHGLKPIGEHAVIAHKQTSDIENI